MDTSITHPGELSSILKENIFFLFNKNISSQWMSGHGDGEDWDLTELLHFESLVSWVKSHPQRHWSQSATLCFTSPLTQHRCGLLLTDSAPAAAAARVSHAVATHPDFHHPSHISPSSCFVVQHFIQCNEMLVLSSLAQTNKYPNQPTVCYILLEGKEPIYFIFYTTTTFIFFVHRHRPGTFHFT